jgi:hypothetical protein
MAQSGSPERLVWSTWIDQAQLATSMKDSDWLRCTFARNGGLRRALLPLERLERRSEVRLDGSLCPLALHLTRSACTGTFRANSSFPSESSLVVLCQCRLFCQMSPSTRSPSQPFFSRSAYTA